MNDMQLRNALDNSTLDVIELLMFDQIENEERLGIALKIVSALTGAITSQGSQSERMNRALLSMDAIYREAETHMTEQAVLVRHQNNILARRNINQRREQQ